MGFISWWPRPKSNTVCECEQYMGPLAQVGDINGWVAELASTPASYSLGATRTLGHYYFFVQPSFGGGVIRNECLPATVLVGQSHLDRCSGQCFSRCMCIVAPKRDVFSLEADACSSRLAGH